jgi:hypothetical protein
MPSDGHVITESSLPRARADDRPNLGRVNETGMRFRYDYAVQTIQVLRGRA